MGEVSKRGLKTGALDVLESFTKLFPLIIFIVYTIGYLYLKFYYSGLGVFFEYYVSLTDIIFFSLNRLVRVVLLYFIIYGLIKMTFFLKKRSIIYKIQNRSKSKNLDMAKRAYSRYRNKIYYDYRRWVVFLLIPSSFLSTLSGFFSDVNGSISGGFEIIMIAFIMGAYFLLFTDSDTESNFENSLLKLAVAIIFISGFSILLGISDSKNIGENSRNLYLKFDYEGNVYSTIGGEYIFVGETSQYLFLYEKVGKSTKVFPKDKIQRLEFYSKSNLFPDFFIP